jgi:hypothetical protein
MVKTNYTKTLKIYNKFKYLRYNLFQVKLIELISAMILILSLSFGLYSQFMSQSYFFKIIIHKSIVLNKKTILNFS